MVFTTNTPLQLDKGSEASKDAIGILGKHMPDFRNPLLGMHLAGQRPWNDGFHEAIERVRCRERALTRWQRRNSSPGRWPGGPVSGCPDICIFV